MFVSLFCAGAYKNFSFRLANNVSSTSDRSETSSQVCTIWKSNQLCVLPSGKEENVEMDQLLLIWHAFASFFFRIFFCHVFSYDCILLIFRWR